MASSTSSSCSSSTDRFGQQHVAGTVTQLVHGRFVEGIDFQHFGERYIGDLFSSDEKALGDQDVGDFLINIQLFHED